VKILNDNYTMLEDIRNEGVWGNKIPQIIKDQSLLMTAMDYCPPSREHLDA